MAKASTLLTLEWDKPNAVAKIIKKHRTNMQKAIATFFDITRREAVKEIIPRTAKIAIWYKMNKQQPSHPTKVTERLGYLNKMLLLWTETPGSRWEVSPRMAKQKTGGLYSSIKTEDSGSEFEKYQASIYNRLDDSFPYLNEGRARRYIAGDMALRKKKLNMRPRHETGIRGKARPFLSVAAKKNQDSFHSVIQAKWDELSQY